MSLFKPKPTKVTADTTPAKKSTDALKDYIDRTSGNVDVGADTSAGKQDANSLLGYISRSSANVKVGADTSAFNKAMSELTVPQKTVGVLAPHAAGGATSPGPAARRTTRSRRCSPMESSSSARPR
ncbi:hypothetical protein GCM10025864_39630 [Luteimicrobium album]|uniref:Uncharacterized protein n=2 Tax=Luteimicrobium album TaxID=1054550 RepID=A0ABQ6I886_9MICO|nr:hypothetical protein GCM10025864_39630 [Luteimicrobium album]